MKTNLFVRVQEYIRLLSDPRFGSFLRSEERDQISKRISRFVAIVIGVNKNIRESTFIDLFLFLKILENSNILDDWTIAIFLVLDKQKTDWNSAEIRKFVNCVNEIFSGVFLYVTRIVCSIFCRYRGIESKIKNISN